MRKFGEFSPKTSKISFFWVEKQKMVRVIYWLLCNLTITRSGDGERWGSEIEVK
jgi:hypothetical protein